MIFSNAGMATLADSIDDIVRTDDGSNVDSPKYYFDEVNGSRNQDKDNLEGEKPEEGEDNKKDNEEEPEEDEETSVEESSIDETTAEEINTDETTLEETSTEESSSDETSSSIASSETIDLAPEEKIASESDAKEDMVIDSLECEESIASESDVKENVNTINLEIEVNVASDSNTLFGASPNSIKYVLGTRSNIGSFISGYTPPDEYTPGVELPLPTSDKVTPPSGRTFDSWLINGERANAISATSTGEVIVTALYHTNDLYYFGMYPQSATYSDVVDPIAWKRFEFGDNVILVANKLLDTKTYYVAGGNITWEYSDLRNWTNNTFYNTAFNTNEKNAIKEVNNDNSDYPYNRTAGGNNTDDKVFVLNIKEALNLYDSDSERIAKGTPYAKFVDNNGYHLYYNPSTGNSYNWLRSPGMSQDQAQIVWVSGAMTEVYSRSVSENTYGVRPALYLNINSPYLDSVESNIQWNLNGGVLLDESTWLSLTKYKEGYAVTLPEERNFKTKPSDSSFVGWRINDSENIVTAIPASQTGNINLKTLWGYDINWILGAGNDWAPGYVASSSYIQGDTLILPTKDNVVGPIGQELDYWTVNSRQDTAIRPTDSGILNIEAHYKNAKYNIVWDLGTGTDAGTWDSYTPPAKYEYSVGLNLDTLPISSKVKPPTGREFDHWTINGTPGTEISTTDTGEKTIKAIYRNIHYNITWVLGSDASWTGGTAPFDDYEYGVNTPLPVAADLTFTGGKSFGSWAIDGSAPKSNISNTQINDIVVTLVYYGTPQHTIMWNHFTSYGAWSTTTDYIEATTYTEGIEILLPNNAQLIPPTGYVLDYWTINGAQIAGAKIPADLSLNPGDTVTVGAVFKLPAPPPTPGPTPSPPGGGGGSIRGGNNFGDPKTFDLFMLTKLNSSEYEWVKDVAIDNWHIKVKKNTPIAKAFTSSNMYVKYYSDIDNNYIMLRNGIFNIQYLNSNYSFAFDANGKMVTGVINTDYFCKSMTVDLVSSTLIELDKIGVNKFYCYEELGPLEGVLCTNSVIVKNIQYIIDEYGRLVSQVSIPNSIIS